MQLSTEFAGQRCEAAAKKWFGDAHMPLAKEVGWGILFIVFEQIQVCIAIIFCSYSLVVLVVSCA